MNCKSVNQRKHVNPPFLGFHFPDILGRFWPFLRFGDTCTQHFSSVLQNEGGWPMTLSCLGFLSKVLANPSPVHFREKRHKNPLKITNQKYIWAPKIQRARTPHVGFAMGQTPSERQNSRECILRKSGEKSLKQRANRRTRGNRPVCAGGRFATPNSRLKTTEE